MGDNAALQSFNSLLGILKRDITNINENLDAGFNSLLGILKHCYRVTLFPLYESFNSLLGILKRDITNINENLDAGFNSLLGILKPKETSRQVFQNIVSIPY